MLIFQILTELSTEPLANKLFDIIAKDLTGSVWPFKVFKTKIKENYKEIS